METLHHLQCFTHRTIWSNRNWINDHSGFRPLNFVDLLSLPLDAHVFVNDTDAALLCQGNCQRRFRHGVHGRRAKWNLESNVSSELGRSVRLVRQYI